MIINFDVDIYVTFLSDFSCVSYANTVAKVRYFRKRLIRITSEADKFLSVK